MWNFQGVAHRLHVSAQLGVGRSENGVRSITYLKTRWKINKIHSIDEFEKGACKVNRGYGKTQKVGRREK